MIKASDGYVHLDLQPVELYPAFRHTHDENTNSITEGFVPAFKSGLAEIIVITTFIRLPMRPTYLGGCASSNS